MPRACRTKSPEVKSRSTTLVADGDTRHGAGADRIAPGAFELEQRSGQIPPVSGDEHVVLTYFDRIGTGGLARERDAAIGRSGEDRAERTRERGTVDRFVVARVAGA